MYATALPSLPSVTAASIKDGCWNLTICFNVSKEVLGNGRLNLPIKQQNTPQDAPRILNEGELNPELCSLMYNLIPKWLSNLISFDDSYRSIPISTSRITFSTLLNSSTSFFDQTASGFTYRSSVVGLYYDVIYDLLPTEETLRSTLEKSRQFIDMNLLSFLKQCISCRCLDSLFCYSEGQVHLSSRILIPNLRYRNSNNIISKHRRFIALYSLSSNKEDTAKRLFRSRAWLPAKAAIPV